MIINELLTRFTYFNKLKSSHIPFILGSNIFGLKKNFY